MSCGTTTGASVKLVAVKSAAPSAGTMAVWSNLTMSMDATTTEMAGEGGYGMRYTS
jgi:hypothetical protein